MELSKSLKKARENAGLSQAEVAEKLNISMQAISKWKNGWTSPDIDNLVILSDLYDVSLDELFKNENNKKKKDDSTIVFFNSYLFKFNFCKAHFEQDEQLYCGKREKQYGSRY